jgi:hypothetical protein
MFLGKIPIMLQSNYCVLKNKINKGLTDFGEVSEAPTQRCGACSEDGG